MYTDIFEVADWHFQIKNAMKTSQCNIWQETFWSKSSKMTFQMQDHTKKMDPIYYIFLLFSISEIIFLML